MSSWIEIQKQPIKEMMKLNLQLAGSRHIRDDNGLTFYSVTGNQQSGKSSYGMCILSELYNGDVEEILKHIVMSAKEFTEIIDKALTEGYREKCIMWDDMSLSGSAATWIKDPQMVMYLAALGDTLAIATKSIILTSPSGDMIKAFRNYQKYIIQIGMGSHRNLRTAKGYFIGKSPMQQRWCSAVFEDTFDTRIPFYERYAQKRKEISLEAVKNMKKMFNDNDDNGIEHIKKQSLRDMFGEGKLMEMYNKKGSWPKVAEYVNDFMGTSYTGEAFRKIATTTQHPSQLSTTPDEKEIL